MRKLAMLMSAALILISGCTRRLVDFTIISSKNVEWTKAATFKRANARVRGEDMVHWIIVIPTGVPNAKEAMDRAIQSAPGAVALLDGVIYMRFWWIPYVYGQQSYIVEGTPLIDPSLASAWDYGQYVVTYLDGDGRVKQTVGVTKEAYQEIKSKMIPLPDGN